MRKIDAFAHILPPGYAKRLEAITSGAGVSDRILGYRRWIHEDAAPAGRRHRRDLRRQRKEGAADPA